MSDGQELDIGALVSGLEALTLPNERFKHREHLRFAHYRLLRDGYPFALESVGDAIARYARHHGQARKYHVTLTECWVRLLAGALAVEPRDATFDDVMRRHPDLLDPALPLRYYSRERLFGEAARVRWCEPDLRELPRCPIHRGVAA
jgi:hypothetical protein